MTFDELELVEAIPLPALIVGRDIRIKCSNARMKEVAGLIQVDLPFVSAIRQPALVDAVKGTLKDGMPRNAIYQSFKARSEGEYYVVVAPIGDCVLVTFQDQSELRSVALMRREFVANVSHELRTPLTSVLGFIETLQGPARDDVAGRDRFLSIMHDEAIRMENLIDDLLSLSRVEENERKRPDQQVAIVPLLESIISSLKPKADAVQVELLLENGCDVATAIPGDAEQLRQVFNNLIENAIKYGAGGGRIEIEISAKHTVASSNTDGTSVTVRDYGAGIESHHIARLTERFYRVDKHRSREVGGTGLGLAIVKHIVNRHRGRLKISSVVGEGSAFVVELPIMLEKTDN